MTIYAWGYISRERTKVRVVYIPKIGKKDHAQPKPFNPISITSFLLKTMEKVINLQVKERLQKLHLLLIKQHAYQKGKSSKTALSN